MVNIPWIGQDQVGFPPTQKALKDPNGLLATGGDLSPTRLLCAYKQGIFPWYSEGQPILWWTPDPRMVLAPSSIHISRSLRKVMKKKTFEVTADREFAAVVRACAAPRDDEMPGTWITNDMAQAYLTLHEMGYAHSIEMWQQQHLVGGLYGIAIGKVFFGESMFSRVDNASKVALVYLCGQLQQWGFKLIDCQVESDHLSRLGAGNISRQQFEQLLREYTNIGAVEAAATPELKPGKWRLTWQFPE